MESKRTMRAERQNGLRGKRASSVERRASSVEGMRWTPPLITVSTPVSPSSCRTQRRGRSGDGSDPPTIHPYQVAAREAARPRGSGRRLWRLRVVMPSCPSIGARSHGCSAPSLPEQPYRCSRLTHSGPSTTPAEQIWTDSGGSESQSLKET